MEISQKEFKLGIQAFQEREKRDAMYKVATFLIDHFWGNPHEMADSLGVLLLTWNQAFYRYGPFDYDKLEQCISKNMDILTDYRQRSILSIAKEDENSIKNLFKQFRISLQICEGAKKGSKSPVGTSKALHLLAPDFFPIWDDKISRAYNCYYGGAALPEEKYILFMKRMKQIIRDVQSFYDPTQTNKTLLKLVDEYNYAKFTKSWI